jgi:hypothetical protein
MSSWIHEIALRVIVFVSFFVYCAALLLIILGIEGKTLPEYRVIMILAGVLLVPFAPIAAGLLAARLDERKRTCIRYAIGGMFFPGIWVFLSIQRHRASRELTDITQTREPRGVESLIQCARGNRDPTIRADAISWLSNIKTSRVLEMLTDALKDKDRRVRRATADALGQIGDERAVEPLRTAQEDKDEEVRQAAISALERLIGTPVTKAKPLSSDIPAAPIGGKVSRCSKCGRQYEESLRIGGGSVKVAKCGACPVNRIFMVCEHCADLEKIVRSPCPWCGARNLWQIQEMEQK